MEWGDWSWEPTVLLGLGVIWATYVIATWQGWISPDDDTTPWFRRPGARVVCFASGILVGLVALQSPIDKGGDEFLFSLHMLQHILLMMVAPPLVLLGLVGLRPPAGGWRRLRRAWWVITRPWPAVLLFNAVMLVWHVPALYDTTLTNGTVHVLEHLSFLAAGVVFWWPVVDPIRGPGTVSVSPLTKIAVLVVGGIPPTVLGLIFALARAPFYDFYVRAPRLWGLSPVADQQIGGVMMLGLGNIIYFVAITLIFIRMLGDAAGDEADAAQSLGRPVPG